MGSATLTTRANGTEVQDSWFDTILAALALNIVPRNSSNVATTIGASLGTLLLPWKRLHVRTGHWRAGDTKMHHSFNGLVAVGQGWMLMDGRIVNQTTYDAEHGAGSWTTYIGSSQFEGKYLPSQPGRYQVGATTDGQDGVTPFTAQGAPGNVGQIQHGHRWYKSNAITDPDQNYDAAGAARAFAQGANKLNLQSLSVSANGTTVDMYTDQQLSAISVQPESIETQMYMRII